MSDSLRRLASRRTLTQTAKTLAVSALFAFGAASAQAQTTYQYQGGGTVGAPTSGVFSTGFTPTISADGTTSQTTTADTLRFGGAAGGASYTATDDLATTINANALSFSNIAGIVATLARSTATGANNSITLGTTGTTAPTVTSRAGAVVNGLDLILANNTTFNIGAGGFSQNGAVSGAGSLTQTGSGGLILSGNNTYTGGTLVTTNGNFGIGSDTAAGTGTITLGAANAGTNIFVSSLGGDRTIANNVVYNGNRLIIDSNADGSGLAVGSLIVNGNWAFNGTAPADIFLRKNLTLNGVVSGSDSGNGITLFGDAGILALTNAGNTFTGGIKYSNTSVVLASSDGALGAAANTLAFQIAGNGTLGNGTLRAGASFNSARNANVATGVTGTFDTNGFNLGLSGILSGTTTGGYNKAGAGTLTLSGANTYTGATTITAGTLMLGAAGATTTGTSGSLGAFSGSIAANGGILDLAGFSDATNALSGTAGTILNSSAGTTSTLTVGSNNGGGTFAGTIADNGGTGGTLALTKIGTGTETLLGTGTYTGPTSINAGSLYVRGSNAIGSGSTVNVATGASLQVAFSASGAGTLTDNAPITLNGNQGSSAAGLLFPTNNTNTYTLNGPITLAAGGGNIYGYGLQNTYNLNGVISGIGGLTVTGAGGVNAIPQTFKFGAANTYAGNTTLSGNTGNTVFTLGVANALPTTTVVQMLGSSATATGTLNLNGFS